MRAAFAGTAAAAVIAALAGCGSTIQAPRADDPSASVIDSVRAALGTDRVEGAELDGSRLSVRLRPESEAGQASISLWYGKLFAQELSNRLDRRISEVDYVGSDANGGADRRVEPMEPPRPLVADDCRKVGDAYTAAEVKPTAQIDVLGGACTFVVHPSNAEGFVSDAGGALASLRDLPGGPNARPSLIEVVDDRGVLRFVLWWIPAFAGGIGQGGAWVQPGWRSSAIIGQEIQAPSSVTFDPAAPYTG